MSLNRPMSNGAKRPLAEEFYGESKRIKSDDRASGDGVSEKHEVEEDRIPYRSTSSFSKARLINSFCRNHLLNLHQTEEIHIPSRQYMTDESIRKTAAAVRTISSPVRLFKPHVSQAVKPFLRVRRSRYHLRH